MKILLTIIATAIMVTFFLVPFHFMVSERIRADRLAMKAERDACYQEQYQMRKEIAKMHKSWIKIRGKK